jgi:hypothetical protein
MLRRDDAGSGKREVRMNPEIPTKRRKMGTKATRKLKVMAPAMKKMLSSRDLDTTLAENSRNRAKKLGSGSG